MALKRTALLTWNNSLKVYSQSGNHQPVQKLLTTNSPLEMMMLLIKAPAFLNQTLIEMMDIPDHRAIDTIVQYRPDPVVFRVEIRAVRWPLYW